ncbi:MAG: hypothetical protein ACTSYE_09195 [Alphaproteobacteria bacterium]
MTEIAGYLFSVLAGFAALFQMALVAGAPWGERTLGGRWPGTLPPALRPVAVLQAAIQLAMAAAVLSRAGIIALLPGWAFWVALALTVLSVGVHIVTPSGPERRLWLPVLILMLICGAVVALG